MKVTNWQAHSLRGFISGNLGNKQSIRDAFEQGKAAAMLGCLPYLALAYRVADGGEWGLMGPLVNRVIA